MLTRPPLNRASSAQTLPFRRSAVFHVALLAVFTLFFLLATALDTVPLRARVVLLCIGTCLVTWTPLTGVPKVDKTANKTASARGRAAN